MEKTLDLYITKMCNLSCEYCYVDIGSDSTTFSTPAFLGRKFLKEYDHIKFFGGEPLLKWTDIVQIIELIIIHKPKMKFTLVTNGVLLNQEKCDFLKKYGVAVVISLHTFPGARKLEKVIHTVVSTLDIRLYDFLFVLSEKTIMQSLQDVQYLLSVGVKNINITPDSSNLWNGSRFSLLQYAVIYLRNLAFLHPDISLRFCDTIRLVQDTVSCRKTIFYGDALFPCNRFQRLKHISSTFYTSIYESLGKAGYYSCPDRFFFSCPIGFFLDHVGLPFDEVAMAYMQINQLFITTEKEVSLRHKRQNYLTIFPKEVRFNTTNQCNLRCEYCYVDFDNTTLSGNEMLRIVTYFLQKGSPLKKISFFGGEPLLTYDVIEKIIPKIIDLYTENNIPKPVFQIATNALLLDTQKLDFLEKYEVSVHITLGGNKSDHNRLRNGTWDQTQLIIESHDLYHRNNTVFLLMIDELSVQNLAKSYIRLASLGCSFIHIECVFHENVWSNESIRILKKQLLLIYAYDEGERVTPYESDGLYDISADGRIHNESLSFHKKYNLQMKDILDTFMAMIFQKLNPN